MLGALQGLLKATEEEEGEGQGEGEGRRKKRIANKQTKPYTLIFGEGEQNKERRGSWVTTFALSKVHLESTV